MALSGLVEKALLPVSRPGFETENALLKLKYVINVTERQPSDTVFCPQNEVGSSNPGVRMSVERVYDRGRNVEAERRLVYRVNDVSRALRWLIAKSAITLLA